MRSLISKSSEYKNLPEDKLVPFIGMQVFFHSTLYIVNDIGGELAKVSPVLPTTGTNSNRQLGTYSHAYSPWILPGTPKASREITASENVIINNTLNDLGNGKLRGLEYQYYSCKQLCDDSYLWGKDTKGLIIPVFIATHLFKYQPSPTGTIEITAEQLKTQNTDGRTNCVKCGASLKTPYPWEPQYNYCLKCES